jgi:hypothetical protein
VCGAGCQHAEKLSLHGFSGVSIMYERAASGKREVRHAAARCPVLAGGQQQPPRGRGHQAAASAGCRSLAGPPEGVLLLDVVGQRLCCLHRQSGVAAGWKGRVERGPRQGCTGVPRSGVCRREPTVRASITEPCGHFSGAQHAPALRAGRRDAKIRAERQLQGRRGCAACTLTAAASGAARPCRPRQAAAAAPRAPPTPCGVGRGR